MSGLQPYFAVVHDQERHKCVVDGLVRWCACEEPCPEVTIEVIYNERVYAKISAARGQRTRLFACHPEARIVVIDETGMRTVTEDLQAKYEESERILERAAKQADADRRAALG